MEVSYPPVRLPLLETHHPSQYAHSSTFSCVCARVHVSRLIQSWPNLERLDLHGVDCAELPPAAVRQLSRLTCLHTLSLQGANTTPVMLQVPQGQGSGRQQGEAE